VPSLVLFDQKNPLNNIILITDFLGRVINEATYNNPIIYIYDDGSVEKIYQKK